jgi:hypothetical protein
LVRTLICVVLGGAALIAIATVVSLLGPMLALDLYTPPVAVSWTVFTAIAVQGDLRVRSAGGRDPAACAVAARGGRHIHYHLHDAHLRRLVMEARRSVTWITG